MEKKVSFFLVVVIGNVASKYICTNKMSDTISWQSQERKSKILTFLQIFQKCSSQCCKDIVSLVQFHFDALFYKFYFKHYIYMCVPNPLRSRAIENIELNRMSFLISPLWISIAPLTTSFHMLWKFLKGSIRFFGFDVKISYSKVFSSFDE